MYLQKQIITPKCLKEVTYNFINEDLLALSNNKSGLLSFSAEYSKLGIPNACTECFVRATVLYMLDEAAALLPKGYSFMIFDAWRPYAVQLALYNIYYTTLVKDYGNIRAKTMIKKFVSYPSKDISVPSPHTTGGSVDLTILDKFGDPLDMGTSFDYFGSKGYTDYFEFHDGFDTIRSNRRLLYNIMTEVGFTNLNSEWWHYDYGTSFWSERTGKSALYYGILA